MGWLIFLVNLTGCRIMSILKRNTSGYAFQRRSKRFNWGEKSQPACEWYCSMGRGSILKERWLEDKILSSSRALGTSTFWFIWASTQPSATRSFLPWYTVLCQPVNRNKSFLSKLLPVRPLTTAMRKVTYYRHSRSLRLENQRNSCSVSWSSQPLDFFS